MKWLSKWFSKWKKEPDAPVAEYYSAEEIGAIDSYIAKNFGEFGEVLHEIVSPDIHVDIVMIKPTEERNYYTLVTMGMGAHRMNIPPELAEYRLDRAEMMICLPPCWKLPIAISGDEAKINENDPDNSAHENWYWPIRWLKNVARLPVWNNTWIGLGHTVPNGPEAEPFAENTKLGCMIIVPPFQFSEEVMACEMPDGSHVTFYQMFPIYADEMNYKLANDLDVLMEKFGELPEVVDINRPSILSGERP